MSRGSRGSCFSALFAIATAVISGGIDVVSAIHQKKENERNRAEAKSLANIVRQDVLKKQNDMNQLTANSLDLNQRKLNFDNTLANMSIANKEDQKQTLIGTTNQNITNSNADRLLDPISGRLVSNKRFI